MQLGMVFRKIGAAVIVARGASAMRRRDESAWPPALCMSACVYAFFGGKKRVVPAVSQLGIHRMVINEAVHDPSGGTMRQQIFGTDDIVSTLQRLYEDTWASILASSHTRSRSRPIRSIS